MLSIFESPYLIRTLSCFLTRKEKLNLILTCKFINDKKRTFLFSELTIITDFIENSWFFNSLTNIAIRYPLQRFPVYTNRLIICYPVNEVPKIPKTVEILNLNCGKGSWTKYISKSNPLIFHFFRERNFIDGFYQKDVEFFQKDKLIVPSGIKSLRVPSDLEVDIPASVDMIRIDFQKIKTNFFDEIPKSVKCLMIKHRTKNTDFKIPNFIEKIILSNGTSMKNLIIPISVKTLVFDKCFHSRDHVIYYPATVETLIFDKKLEKYQFVKK